MPRSLFYQSLLDSDMFRVSLACMGGFGFPLGLLLGWIESLRILWNNP